MLKPASLKSHTKTRIFSKLFTPFATVFFLLQMNAAAQESKPAYPQDFFRNPLNIPILLAGNFGEPRPNHFHSGIDIKTNGKENQPVYAAADGFVSRIKMDKGGFGHALYVTHPNGFTTLYAHLNNFNPQLQAFLKKMQYREEKWAVDLTLQPDQFPVKKGTQIAWSGNTGASTAPHLHFEIRDSQTEHPLNPQLFGLSITDSRAPVPSKMAVYNLEGNIYAQKLQFFDLKKQGSTYTTAQDTIVMDARMAGISIAVNDFMNGSDNTLNFFTATWSMDDTQMGSIKLDDIGYEETRYLHAYTDYRLHEEKNAWYQCLFKLPNNRLRIYPDLKENGTFHFTDKNPHKIEINLTDAAGNNTEISFYAKSNLTPAPPLDCAHYFTAGRANSFQEPNVKFELPPTALYESLCFSLRHSPVVSGYSGKYELASTAIPVHNYFDLFLKREVPVPFALRDKIVMVYSDRKSQSAQAAMNEDGWYKASVRKFGAYWLAADTIPPIIKSRQKENAQLAVAKTLSFSVNETTTSVQNFKAMLDGKWLMFEPHGNLFTYTFDEHCPKGKHELIITAADENNNTAKFVYHFTR